MLQKLKSYVWSILIALAVGGLSAFITRGSMDIYNEIKTPPLSPPSWLFPVVWSILFVLMGISATMIARNQTATNQDKEKALTFYAISLVFNFTWSIVFFNFRAFSVAFVILCVLWYLILRTILSYNKIDQLAAKLQIPYLLWVSFAGYLNLAIAILN